MADRPDLRELLESVREYITDEVASSTRDPRERFRALVAANVLAIAEREIVSQRAAIPGDDEKLADELRSGRLEATPGDEVWRQVRASLVDSLRIEPWLPRANGIRRVSLVERKLKR